MSGMTLSREAAREAVDVNSAADAASLTPQEARDALNAKYSAIMGATAFAKGLGAMHALSHAIGALEGRHHGLTNAVLMPFVLAHNRPSIEAPMAELAHALRLPDGDFAAACDWILRLRRAVGIPATLGALGVVPERFAAIARLAARDICAATNPRPVDEASLGGILQAAA